MKKALMLRGLLAAATLSLGSVALAGSAGATNLTINMYVGTNVDTPTASTLSGWGSNDWSMYSDATDTSHGQWAAAYADCHAASNTDCSLRETVWVSQLWWLQPSVVAAFNTDIAASIAYDQTNAGGNATLQEATAYENDMNQNGSTISRDIGAGPGGDLVNSGANPAYSRYVLNFTQLKATYTISASSGGGLFSNGDINLNVVGRGVNNTTIVGDGNTSFLYQDNGNASGPNSVSLQDITFKNFNYDGQGAVLWASGNATTNLNNVNFSRNIGTSSGIVYSTATVNVTGGSFVKNADNSGGAIYSTGSLTVKGTQFSGNNAEDNNGGAIYFSGNDLTVSNSSFDRNVSSNTDRGGAIYTEGSTTTLTNDTFLGNSAGSGGAVDANDGTVAVLNSTFVGNTANYGGGGILAESGNGNVTVGSSIFANNTLFGGIQNFCSTWGNAARFVSLGGNVVQDGTGSTCVLGSHDKFVKSFKLGAYGFHGGKAQTIPLVAKSAGTAFAPRATCATKDARGVSRGTTGTCDAGSYQVTKK